MRERHNCGVGWRKKDVSCEAVGRRCKEPVPEVMVPKADLVQRLLLESGVWLEARCNLIYADCRLAEV